MAAWIAIALAIAACGGGGGGGSAASGGTDQTPQAGGTGGGQTQDSGDSTGPAPHAGPDAFMFSPSAALAAAGAIDHLAGGDKLFAAWNPNDPKTALKPGMKVMFFGSAQGCAQGTQGPLSALSDPRLAAVASLTKLPHAAALSALRWTPSGATSGCDSVAQARDGASAVFVNADDAAGAVGMLTASGQQDDGNAPFFGPFGAGGQNGQGANAYIGGTFVNFRQPWWVADPLQPWSAGASARVRSVQSLGAFQLDTAGPAVQAKQQMMATFLNSTCARTVSDQPCQVQYLFNTAIARSGVSDWSQVSWFRNGAVWFDPVQGSIPVVDGPIYASGQLTMDGQTGLPLYLSQGSASQHAAFSGRTFDVTISFEQLQNVLRIVAARKLGVELAALTDAQVAEVWGAAWDDRDAWVLLSADVGQEVYNPDSSRKVLVGGGFRSLFVGPQG